MRQNPARPRPSRRSRTAKPTVVEVDARSLARSMVSGWPDRIVIEISISGGAASAQSIAASPRRLDDPDVRQFLDEATEIRPGRSTSAAALHAAYVRWSEDRGQSPLTAITFARSLTALGLRRTKRSVSTYLDVVVRSQWSGNAPA